MSCRPHRARLGPYLEGDLGDAERARTAAHLESCASCRQELALLHGTVALLRGLPDVEPPPHLAQRVVARLRDGEGAASFWDRLAAALGSRAFGAGCAGAVAGALLVSVAMRATPPDPRAEADALRAALREAPVPTPDLELGPRFGAAAAPEVPTAEALLGMALDDPAKALRALRGAPAGERGPLADELARLARERGEAHALAASLHSLGADADALVRRLGADAHDADAF